MICQINMIMPVIHTWKKTNDNVCYGTDTIVTYAAVNLVRENASAEAQIYDELYHIPMYVYRAGIFVYCIDGVIGTTAERFGKI